MQFATCLMFIPLLFVSEKTEPYNKYGIWKNVTFRFQLWNMSFIESHNWPKQVLGNRKYETLIKDIELL